LFQRSAKLRYEILWAQFLIKHFFSFWFVLRGVLSKKCEPTGKLWAQSKKNIFFFLAPCFALFQRSVKLQVRSESNFKKMCFSFLAPCFALFQRSVKLQALSESNFKKIYFFFLGSLGVKSKKCKIAGEPNFKQMHPFSTFFVVFNQRSVKSRVEMLWGQF
jgi:hypothetical protein